jgi:hypothetical protein
MLLRYKWMRMQELDFWKVIEPSGIRVIDGLWRWYRGEDGEYI